MWLWGWALAHANPVAVEVERNLELVSLVFHLAQSEEYAWADSPYKTAADEWFKGQMTAPVVVQARVLRRLHGMSYNAPPSLALLLDDELRLPRGMRELPESVDDRWTLEDAKEFAKNLRKFRKKSDFDGFWDTQSASITAATSAMEGHIAELGLSEWLTDTFGDTAVNLQVVPSLTVGPNNYGISVRRADGSLAVRPVIGLRWKDGVPVVSGDSTTMLIAHEIAHPFVNPIVEARPDLWMDAAKAAYAARRAQMDSAAYPSAKIVANETAVRGIVSWFAFEKLGEDAACKQVVSNAKRGFPGVGELGQAFAEAEGSWTKALPRLGEIMTEYVDYRPSKVLNAVQGRKERTKVVIAPAEGPAHDYAEEMTAWLTEKSDLATYQLQEAAEDSLLDEVNNVYGAPANIPGLSELLAANGWTVEPDHIAFGDVRWDGEDLVLIAVLEREGAKPLVAYTGSSDEVVAGANGVFHGPTPWVVARKGEDGTHEVLADGLPARWPGCGL